MAWIGIEHQSEFIGALVVGGDFTVDGCR